MATAAKQQEAKRFWSSTEIKALLQERFGGGGAHAVLFEVRNSTGHAANRSIDAVTMTLWPSLGLELAGMEIKISRSDWLRELKDPAKASATFEYFDRWYLVAPRNVAQMDEIPGPWGWLAPEDDKIITIKKAPLNENVKPVDRSFLASMLRCESKNDEKLINAAVNQAVATEARRLREIHDGRVDSEVQRRMGEIGADAEKFKKLREALGDSLGWMNDEEMLRAIRATLSSGLHRTWGGLRDLQKQLAKQAEDLKLVIDQNGAIIEPDAEA